MHVIINQLIFDTRFALTDSAFRSLTLEVWLIDRAVTIIYT